MAALGMIEVYGYTTSIIVADVVAKTADVKVVAIDKNKPAGGDSAEVPLVMVVKFQGRADAVKSAMESGVEEAKRRGLYITSKLIAGLDDQVQWFAELTATGKDKLRNMDK